MTWMTGFNWIFLVLFSGVCWACARKLKKEKLVVTLDGLPAEAVGENNRLYNLLVGLAFGVAMFMRVFRFGEVPFGVWCDGAMAAVDAKALAEYGTDRYGMAYPVHLTAWGYGQMSSLLSYMMVPFIQLFGFSVTAVRLPSLLISLAGLVCLFLLCRSAFNKWCALAVLGFAAVNPWHVMQSRWALDCNLYSHFFLIGIYMLHEGVAGEKKKKWLLFASMAVFGLAMYCYGTSVYTMPLFLVAACIYLLATKKVSLLDVLWCVLIYLAVSWAFFAVMVINFFHLETIEVLWFTIPYFPASVRSNDILFFSDNFLGDLGFNFVSTAFIVFQITRDELLNMVPGFGTMFVFSIPFMALGFYQLCKHAKRSVSAVLILMFFGTGVFSGLVTHDVNIWRLNIIFYSLFCMSGVGIYTCLRVFKKIRWVVVPVYAAAAVLFFNGYFVANEASVGHPFYRGFCEALVDIKDADVEKIYITNKTLSDEKHSEVGRNEILVMFYHEVDSQEYYGIGEYEGKMPGRERYVFDWFDSAVEPNDAVYILHYTELEYFDEALFELVRYGEFYVARSHG